MSAAVVTTAQVAARALRNAVADFNAETLSLSSVDRLRANVLYVAGKLDAGDAPYDDATALHSVKVLPLRAVEDGEPA